MFRIKRLNRFSAILIVVFLSIFYAEEPRADALAEFLFWDSLGNTIGKGARAYSDYRAERKLWRDKIAAAKAELKRCGGCASAQAKLDKWQGIEKRFQTVAGGLAQSVGMPPVIAKWLGIRTPGLVTSKRWKRPTITVPSWMEDRPDFCQSAVKSHISCLKNSQKKGGLLRSYSALPGGQCYETGKLFRYCGNKNYEGFWREKAIQKARAAGKIIPEYFPNGPIAQVYYGRVSDDFVPRFPPPEVIGAKLGEKNVRSLKLILFKEGTGQLGVVIFEDFFWTIVAPNSKCFGAPERAPRTEVGLRICDDLTEMNWRYRPPLLRCGFTRQGGSKTSVLDGTIYWYAERPNAANPARLIARSHSHPMLQIGDPRTDCPTTKREANRIDAIYNSKIAKLLSQTPQIPASVVLPRSDWQKKKQARYDAQRNAWAKRALSIFPIEGRYDLSIYRNSRLVRSFSCTITKRGDNQFEVFCTKRRYRFRGTGAIKNGNFVVDWGPDLKIAFRVANKKQLSGLNKRKTVHALLYRTGNI